MGVGVKLVTVGKKGTVYFRRRANKYNLASESCQGFKCWGIYACRKACQGLAMLVLIVWLGNHAAHLNTVDCSKRRPCSASMHSPRPSCWILMRHCAQPANSYVVHLPLQSPSTWASRPPQRRRRALLTSCTPSSCLRRWTRWATWLMEQALYALSPGDITPRHRWLLNESAASAECGKNNCATEECFRMACACCIAVGDWCYLFAVST